MLKHVLCVLMLLPAVMFADCSKVDCEKGTRSKGERLLRRFWNDMRDKNTDLIKRYTSPKFQSVHWFGAFNRKCELELISHLGFNEYELSRIKIKKEHNVYIISYWAKVSETIQGSPCMEEMPRLTIFEKVDGDWKLVAHANLTWPIL